MTKFHKPRFQLHICLQRPWNPLRDQCHGCTSTPQVESPKASIGFEEMPHHGCTLAPEIPSVEVKTPNAEVKIPKPSTSSKEMPSGCTPAFLNALQSFRVDIERAVQNNIKELEEQKIRLKIVLDQSRNEVEVASATIKMLMEDLQNAKKVLSRDDTDENCGEVRYIESAVKLGENKLKMKKAKYDTILLQWRLLVQLLTEKLQAQTSLDSYFRLRDEEDQPINLATSN